MIWLARRKKSGNRSNNQYRFCMKKKIRIFCDFDGTITPSDVGGLLFYKYTDGHAKEIVEKWKAGEIDSRSLYLESIKHLKITPEELDLFLKRQSIDPHFISFVQFCERRSIEVSIISDGMDIYIQPILERNELGYLNVYANKLRWQNGKTLTAEFPYYDHTCGRCANCKGYHLRLFKDKDSELVLIGDGLSDICAAKEADFVFAKGSLAEYCREHKMKYSQFRDFSDVLRGLRNKLMDKFA